MPPLKLRILFIMIFPFSYARIWYQNADFATKDYVKVFSRLTVLDNLILFGNLRVLKSCHQISEISGFDLLSLLEEFYLSYDSDQLVNLFRGPPILSLVKNIFQSVALITFIGCRRYTYILLQLLENILHINLFRQSLEQLSTLLNFLQSTLSFQLLPESLFFHQSVYLIIHFLLNLLFDYGTFEFVEDGLLNLIFLDLYFFWILFLHLLIKHSLEGRSHI